MTEQPITPDEIDSTTATLRGGVANLAISSAVGEIELWQQKLEASGDPGLVKIGGDLGRLRDELTAESLDPEAIGSLLGSLGQQTADTGAGDLPPFIVEKLQVLGRLLTEEGSKVSKG